MLYAYAGFENTAAPAGEFKNPQRDVPFGLIVQIALVTAIYTLVQLVAIGTIPNLGQSPTPLADAGRMLLGPLGGFLLTLGAALSVLGTNNNTVLAGPRYLYALAETGRLPRVFAKIHPRYRTPYVAILTQTGIALGLIAIDAVLHSVKPGALGVAEELAVLSTVARLATYIGTCLAVPVLRRKMPGHAAHDPPSGRARHPDRGARHLPVVPVGGREEEFHRRAPSRWPSGAARLRRARTAPRRSKEKA